MSYYQSNPLRCIHISKKRQVGRSEKDIIESRYKEVSNEDSTDCIKNTFIGLTFYTMLSASYML